MNTYTSTIRIHFPDPRPMDTLHLDECLLSLCPENAFSFTDATHTRYELTVMSPSRQVLDSRMRVLLNVVRRISTRRNFDFVSEIVPNKEDRE